MLMANSQRQVTASAALAAVSGKSLKLLNSSVLGRGNNKICGEWWGLGLKVLNLHCVLLEKSGHFFGREDARKEKFKKKRKKERKKKAEKSKHLIKRESFSTRGEWYSICGGCTPGGKCILTYGDSKR